MPSTIDQLRSQLQSSGLWRLEPPRPNALSTLSKVDAWLPAGGLLAGTFVEFLQEDRIGAYSLALRWALATHKDASKPWAVLDTEGTFNPCAAGMTGWDLERLILIRTDPSEGGWTFAQLLRSKEIGTCFWSSNCMDNMVFRRMQLAAERGGGLGYVIRPLSVLHKPCWGSLRVQVSPVRENTVRLSLLHARGQPQLTLEDIEVAL